MRHRLQLVSAWMTTFAAASKHVTDAISRSGNISVTQFRIMLELTSSGEGLRIVEVSKRLLMKPNTITLAVNQLEESGLVVRRNDPADRRGIWLMLTEEGLSFVESLNTQIRSSLDELWEPLSQRQVDLIFQGTDLITTRMGGQPEKGAAYSRLSTYITTVVTVNKVIADALKSSGLSVPEFRILFELESRGSVSGTQIGTALDMKPSFVTATTDDLAARELVSKLKNSSDRRVATVSLTSTGRELVHAATENVIRVYEDAYADIDDQDLKAHVEAAKLIANHVTEQARTTNG